MIKIAEPIVKDALSYIDAGTGNLIIQMLIAVSLSGLIFLRVFWKKVKVFFRRFFSGSRKGDD